MLRAFIVAAGALLLAGAVVGALLHAPGPAVAGPGIAGILFLVGTLAERVRYKRVRRRRPGPGWRLGTERFVDPETGQVVAVWHNDATGERIYAEADAPAEGR